MNEQSLALFYNLCYSFFVGGLVTVLVTSGMHSSNAMYGTLAGYSVAATALSVVIVLTFMNFGAGVTVLQRLATLMPFLLLMAVLILSIVFLALFIQGIVENQVSPQYSFFTQLSVLLILIQSFLYYGVTSDIRFRQEGVMTTMETAKLTLIGLINVILVINAGISLKYFSTDGFC